MKYVIVVIAIRRVDTEILHSLRATREREKGRERGVERENERGRKKGREE